ncbi:hypothetical protein Taro_007433 [Colocasia esculenta]|uniref:Uncharacterized protein n=1 Tax=Colocasia esculenta TaxID=4460 RepID=A0A843TVE6_COLES|nr:hypothetical protein [Colocasia esculenta]
MGARTCCLLISRVVPCSRINFPVQKLSAVVRINIPVRKPFAVVRYGRADDLPGDMPLRSLTTSDHGGHTLEVFEPP